MTVVACAQLTLLPGDVSACRAITEAAIDNALAAGAELIILPELANTCYAIDHDEARALAEPVAGPSLERWASRVRRRNAIVVAGFCERADDRIYNSCALIDGSGVRAVYRKLHLWDRELGVFDPGRTHPPVVETQFGRIALGICYDLEFPELARAQSLAGADVLALPTATPLSPRPEGTHPMAITLAMAAARLNGIFVACCDHAGHERDIEFAGGSVIISNLGWPLAGPIEHSGEGLIVASCDLDGARDKRRGERNDLFGDRRPTIYQTEGDGLLLP
jgi:predicted amidohydrolase